MILILIYIVKIMMTLSDLEKVLIIGYHSLKNYKFKK